MTAHGVRRRRCRTTSRPLATPPRSVGAGPGAATQRPGPRCPGRRKGTPPRAVEVEDQAQAHPAGRPPRLRERRAPRRALAPLADMGVSSGRDSVPNAWPSVWARPPAARVAAAAATPGLKVRHPHRGVGDPGHHRIPGGRRGRLRPSASGRGRVVITRLHGNRPAAVRRRWLDP